MKRVMVIILVFWAAIFGRDGALALMNDEVKLINHLFQNYSNQARPVLNLSTPIIIKLSVELIQIIGVNERDQYITNKIWMNIRWTNELLKWNPEDWGGISSASVSPEKLWVPDIVLYNENDKDLSKGTRRYKSLINIKADGRHTWLAPSLTTSSCAINVKDFPFDYQTCQMKYGSWTYDNSKLDIIEDNHPIVTSTYIMSPEWNVINATKKVNKVKYSCCINPFMDITFTFSLKRKPLYYVFNLIGPCVILIMINLFSFLLPTDCTERTNLVVTLLLAFVVFLQLINNFLPKNSEATPSLSIFYMSLLVESTCLLFATCLVIFMHQKGSTEGAQFPPEWLRRTILKVSTRRASVEINDSFENKTTADKDKINSMENDYGSQKKLQFEASLHSIAFVKESSASPDGYPLRCLTSNSNNRKKSNRCQSKQEAIEEEWKMLAKILDRSFFFTFIFLYTMSLLLLFSVA